MYVYICMCRSLINAWSVVWLCDNIHSSWELHACTCLCWLPWQLHASTCDCLHVGRTHTVELFPLSQYSFAAGGIQVQRNKLVFNTSGFYHVYSQVTWATGRSVDLEAHNKPEKFTFGHTTMLFTRSYCRSQAKAFLRSIVPLMSSSYPVALNISRYPFTSTHAGSFWLCPGDRVYLQTRALAPCCIQRSETSTFLGAYLVRGPP